MIHNFFEDGTNQIEWEPIEVVQPRALAQIDAKRDAIIEGGFDFHLNGQVHRIQSRQSDRENVMGLAQAAQGAIMAGSQPGDLRWITPSQDFGFITADNTIIALDARDMLSMYEQGLGFKAAATFHARDLKNAVLACQTDEEISALDLTSGWPGEA